jgi:hypothetical protein
MAAIPVCKEIPIIRKDKPAKKIFRTFDRLIRKTSAGNRSAAGFSDE